jgi:Flp pilus assembly protein TadD
MNGLSGNPDSPLIGDAASLLREAAAHFNKQEFRAAATICLKLVDSHPDLGEAWHILGRIGVETSDFTNAVASLARAASLEPENIAIRFSLAQTLDKAAQPERALAAWRAYAQLAPEDHVAQMRIATTLHKQGAFESSVSFYEAALALDPENIDCRNALASALIAADRAVEGANMLEILRAHSPQDAEILNNLGVAYMGLNQLNMSIRRLTQALAIREDWAEPHQNLANALRRAGRLDQAEVHFQLALSIDPNDFRIYGNRALMFISGNKPDAAADSYHRALALAPNEPELRKGLGIAQLMAGDLTAGWRNYESRWNCAGFQRRNFGSERWRGQPIAGASLLIHAEQGFGDTLQFCRYIRLARELAGAARIIIEAQSPLLGLLECLVENDCILMARGAALPPVDFDIPLMSLPALFDTSLDAVPADIPYLSPADPLRQKWATAVDQKIRDKNAMKVGFAWAGNPNRQDDVLRSCPYADFSRLFDHPDAAFFSMQLDSPPGLISQASGIVDLTAEITDFADTAAFIESMDLIITVDTATAHLAGALGKPVWVLLGYAADWRYLMARTDSPWYPSMRLFRQPKHGDWRAVIIDVLDALKNR